MLPCQPDPQLADQSDCFADGLELVGGCREPRLRGGNRAVGEVDCVYGGVETAHKRGGRSKSPLCLLAFLVGSGEFGDRLDPAVVAKNRRVAGDDLSGRTRVERRLEHAASAELVGRGPDRD